MSAGTEIVPVNGDLAEAEAAELAAAISELGAQGDAATLRSVAGEIDARRAYFRRNAMMDQARKAAELVVHAEAELGTIILRGEWPEDVPLGKDERNRMRVLAIGRMRGCLDRAVREAFAGVGDGKLPGWSSAGVAARLRVLGATRVPAGALADAWKQSGMVMKQLAQRSGVPYDTVQISVGSGSRARLGQRSVKYPMAAALARALGVEPTTLPMCRSSHPGNKGQRNWIHRKRKLTGGRWDEAYTRFSSALDEFARVAGEAPEWDEAYEHWHALHTIITRQVGAADPMVRDGP